MTTTITKQECLDLIDGLADKSLTFGQRVFHDGRRKKVLSLWDGMEDKCIGGEHHQTNCDTLYMLEEDPQNFAFEKEITSVSTGRWEYGTAPNPIEDQIKILGHDIYLHDVLAVMEAMHHPNRFQLVTHWGECLDPKDPRSKSGLKRSLQSIFEDLKWEETFVPCPHGENDVCEGHLSAVAKPSPATDLFVFLRDLKLKNY